MRRRHRPRMPWWERAFLVFAIAVFVAFVLAVIFAPQTEHWYLDIPS